MLLISRQCMKQGVLCIVFTMNPESAFISARDIFCISAGALVQIRQGSASIGQRAWHYNEVSVLEQSEVLGIFPQKTESSENRMHKRKVGIMFRYLIAMLALDVSSTRTAIIDSGTGRTAKTLSAESAN